jgi:hypothetical protein
MGDDILGYQELLLEEKRAVMQYISFQTESHQVLKSESIEILFYFMTNVSISLPLEN